MTQDTELSDLQVSITVEAPIDRAFAVLVDRGQEWWPPYYGLGGGERRDLRVEHRAGGRWYEVTGDGREVAWGQVLAWDAPNHVALGWQITPQFGPEPDPDHASRVDVRLDAQGPERTRVTLVHSGFERHGEGGESMRAMVGGDGGWPGLLHAYAELAATTP